MDNHHVLTADEKATLSICKGGEILAAGPWIKGRCELPHRVVIRDDGDQYIVHYQVIPGDGYPYFYAGLYVRKSDANALERAWTDLENRTRNHMGWTPGANLINARES